ncbi:unnamed protein product [Symbiodinium sp. CCMP2592]|nr:unnamed protein product [Symbiodinium sp. CCMP2592]
MDLHAKAGGVFPGKAPGLGPAIPSGFDPDLEPETKKREAAPGATMSPTKKRPESTSAVTMSDLQQLLAEQTFTLQSHQHEAIKAAVHELRDSTRAELGGIKATLSKHDDHILQLRDAQDRMELRLTTLEQKGVTSSAGSTADERAGQMDLMIVGGWEENTPREVLLAELKEALETMGIPDFFRDYFTIGPRKGFAMCLVATTANEAPQDLKRRMIFTAQQIRQQNYKAPSMREGKTLRATLGRTAAERQRAAHVGKSKRLVLEFNQDVLPYTDSEWGQGNFWLNGTVCSSSTRPPPRDAKTAAGKSPGSWIDLGFIARSIGANLDDLAVCIPEQQLDVITPPPSGSTFENPRDRPNKGRPLPTPALPRVLELACFTWNIGGKPLEDAIKSLCLTSPVYPDVIAFQEVARRAVGWKSDQIDQFTIVQTRHDSQWRGNALAFRTDGFSLVQGKSCPHGIWIKLKHKDTGQQIWYGSLRLDTGCTADVAAEQTQILMQTLPNTPLPVLLLGDWNTKLRWTGRASRGEVRPVDGRGDYVTSEVHDRGLKFVPPAPAQWMTPTSRPRRANAAGHQIDGAASMHARTGTVTIFPDSYKLIGGDHDFLRVPHRLRTSCQRPGERRTTQPRTVTGKLPSVTRMDQTIMERLAARLTKPRRSCTYRDPEEVKNLYRRAKTSGSEHDWKTAHKARRTAHDKWRTAKLEEAASGNWAAMKHTKQHAGNEWAVHYIEASDSNQQEPLKWTVEHFRALFQAPAPRQPPCWTKEASQGQPITVEEVNNAVDKGHTNKAVGEDLTSFELLKALVKDPPTGKAIADWMERIRQGEEIPESWTRMIVTLLPKVDKPQGPGDLRPISLGSSIGKTFGTILLARTRYHIAPQGAAQCAHNGRQTSDFLFTALRSFALDSEWKMGLCWAKLDVQKAFDSLNRDRALRLLRDKLPSDMSLEYNCWKRLFEESVAILRTPWGDAEIVQSRGIRQGAVESPWIFAVAIEAALAEAQENRDWPKTIPAAPGIPVSEILFMDDSLVWAADRPMMVTKYNLLRQHLAEWGLRINAAKTRYYVSPYSTTPGPIHLR